MTLTPDDIVRFFRQKARKPLSEKDVLHGLRISKKDRRKAVRLLESMAGSGTLVRLKNGRYSLPRQVNLVIGTVSLHRDGYGFVSSPESSQDVFVPARFLRDVMAGDRVSVRVERSPRSGKPEGRVVQILERAHLSVVGRYERGRNFGYVVPVDPRITHDIYILGEPSLAVKPGEMVIARIDTYPTANRNPDGEVIEVLGDPSDPDVEILTIAHKYELPHRFSEEALAAADRVSDQVLDEDLAGREDLRPVPFVTIDGETARDFDDAVAVAREEGGRIRLWVAIADVGHYVAEGDPIDKDAYERGTSVYFPGRCIPMLPEALSNGICSLNPDVDRLAMAAEMVFDTNGARVESRFYPSVIRSRARLTYTEVRDMLEAPEGALPEAFESLISDIQVMKELASRLMDMRRRRGSLDFDLPGTEVVLGLLGQPEDIVRAERNIAHRIIEECMLAANEAVATFLSEREVPFLYRIHEPPELEKIQAFQTFVAHFNYGLVVGQTGVDPRRLQQLLDEIEGKPEEKLLNHVLLRSMKQASYSADNAGHFGLAADLYCHFTSPIRRYPDLVVHRMLREVLKKGGMSDNRKTSLTQRYHKVGEQTSQRERRAMEAEREIIDLKKCQYMASRVDEEFEGLVASVQPFGFFVELNDVFVEGLVHISSLSDDFYHYEEELHRLVGEHRRRIFQVGESVKVRVAGVNQARREIDFVLTDIEPGQKKARR